MRYLGGFRERLIEEAGAAADGLAGLPPGVLERWNEEHGPLPAAYVEFLRLCGCDSDGRIDEFGLITKGRFGQPVVRAAVEQILRERFGRELPADVWPLEEWLGEYFTFFRIGAGEDPPVYAWSEDDEDAFEPELRADSFSEYLDQRLGEWIRSNR